LGSILPYLAFIPVFGVLVTVHEFGHFIVAKLNGVKVLEFSIGFGPPLARVQRGETVYALRAVPLGGYVRMAGMDDGETGPRSFNAQPVGNRLAIISAGALTNLILPAIILFLAFVGQAGAPVVVQSVVAGDPAQHAGIAPGDRLLEVNGQRVQDVVDFRARIAGNGGGPLDLVVQHAGGGTGTVVITPVQTDGRWIIGVVPRGSFDLAKGAQAAMDQYVGLLGSLAGGFGDLLSGHVPGGLAGPCGPSGPVGIVRATGEAASAGWLPLLVFTAFLSLNLGILNLLPIPALDGGRLLFLVYEAVRRRPLDPQKEQRVHYIGLVVLIGLILLISFNDVLRLPTPFQALVARCQG
jgi:regulator of sigma E protease